MFLRRSSYHSFHFSSDDGKHTRVIYFSVWRLSSWINMKASFLTSILFYYCLFIITTKPLLHTVLHLAQTNLNAQISLAKPEESKVGTVLRGRHRIIKLRTTSPKVQKNFFHQDQRSRCLPIMHFRNTVLCSEKWTMHYHSKPVHISPSFGAFDTSTQRRNIT
jgi:hypothetical protein